MWNHGEKNPTNGQVSERECLIELSKNGSLNKNIEDEDLEEDEFGMRN